MTRWRLTSSAAAAKTSRAAAKTSTPESAVLRACLALLAVHPKCAWARRMNVGGHAFEGRDGRQQFVQFGFKGLSDIIGQMTDGRFLAVECKAPGGRLTPDQEAFLALVAAHGGVACCTDTVEGLVRVLDAA